MPTITGTSGSDTLNGTDGDDSISGLGGNDILIDGAGADTLSGGEGADLFVFSAAGLGNVITDFQSGVDVIELGLLVPVDFFEWLGTNEFTGLYTGEARYVGGILEFDINRDRVADLTVAINAPILPSDFSTYGLIGYLGSGGFGQTFNGTNGPDNLQGSAGNDLLLGLSGNDSLDGGPGRDALEGGGGNDHYVIDDPADTIVEAAFQGDDWLHTSVSYSLAANVSIEAMTTTNAAGTTAISLTGNESGQSIYGNDGNNMLNGGGGIDYLVGLGGNDRYLIDNYGEYAVEASGEGDDWVSTSVSYTLIPGSSIETLNTTNSSSTADIFLGGNEFGQSIYGNAGNNYVYGLGGADYLVGLDGNDVLNGGQGSDYLMGGAGADVFHFDNNGSVDTIGDFDSSDYIDLGSFLGFQQFQFIGSSEFAGWPGQGRFANGKFELDVNGDGIPELTVLVSGTVTEAQFVFWDSFY